jgi:hypothetical protein
VYCNTSMYCSCLRKFKVSWNINKKKLGEEGLRYSFVYILIC